MNEIENEAHGRRVIDVETVTPVYRGFFGLNEVWVKYERPDGSMSKPVKRLSVERGDAVGVLIHDRGSDSMVLVRQFRYPVARHGDPFPIEIVAGSIDEGETALEAGLRECQEEVGIKLDRLEKLVEFYSSPGGLSEMLTLFLAEVESFSRPRGLGGLAGEDIEVVVCGRQEVYDALARGQIRDGKTQVALYRFQETRRFTFANEA